jgi:hypothetical protein
MAVRSYWLRQAQRIELGPQLRYLPLSRNELRRLRSWPLVERAIVFSLRALVERLSIDQAQAQVSVVLRPHQFGSAFQQVRR